MAADPQQYLLIPQVEAFFQALAVDITKLDPNQGVRIEWPPQGQPDWEQSEDVIFVAVTESDDAYDRLRENKYTRTNTPGELTESTYYTRVWEIKFIAYGPNSFDNIRKIRSKMFKQWAHDKCSDFGLFLVTDIPTPKRVPEEFTSVWYERCDLSVRFNESVIENDTIGGVESIPVEIFNETSTPPVADFTVTADE